MILSVMREARNTFFDGNCIKGEFSIRDGILSLSENFKDGSYVLVYGGKNQGIYKLHKLGNDYMINNSVDDDFYGMIFHLRVPKDFLDLVADIEVYVNKASDNNILSERFGEYSYTLQNANEPWEVKFTGRINKFKKMSDTLLDILNGGIDYVA